MIALIASLLCGTPSGWGADSIDCTVEINVPQNIVMARLYRAFCGVGNPVVLVDSLPATAGVEVCFSIDSTVCVSYFVTVVNAAGLESCPAGISFPRVVGVDITPTGEGRDEESYFDLAGRRLPQPPDAPGVYWVKRKGMKVKKIVVMVCR